MNSDSLSELLSGSLYFMCVLFSALKQYSSSLLDAAYRRFGLFFLTGRGSESSCSSILLTSESSTSAFLHGGFSGRETLSRLMGSSGRTDSIR